MKIRPLYALERLSSILIARISRNLLEVNKMVTPDDSFK